MWPEDSGPFSLSHITHKLHSFISYGSPIRHSSPGVSVFQPSYVSRNLFYFMPPYAVFLPSTWGKRTYVYVPSSHLSHVCVLVGVGWVWVWCGLCMYVCVLVVNYNLTINSDGDWMERVLKKRGWDNLHGKTRCLRSLDFCDEGSIGISVLRPTLTRVRLIFVTNSERKSWLKSPTSRRKTSVVTVEPPGWAVRQRNCRMKTPQYQPGPPSGS